MLLDSNIIIYAAQSEHRNLVTLVEKEGVVSAITRVEVLGFHRLGDKERQELNAIFEGLKVLSITRAVIERAINVRQRKSMSVGDAIVAATALEHGLVLATNNEVDFKGVPGLQIENP